MDTNSLLKRYLLGNYHVNNHMQLKYNNVLYRLNEARCNMHRDNYKLPESVSYSENSNTLKNKLKTHSWSATAIKRRDCKSRL